MPHDLSFLKDLDPSVAIMFIVLLFIWKLVSGFQTFVARSEDRFATLLQNITARIDNLAEALQELQHQWKNIYVYMQSQGDKIKKYEKTLNIDNDE